MALSLQTNPDVIDSNREYWFVRTDGGKHFKTFYENGFIAIGWNEITLEDIKNVTPGGNSIKNKLAKVYNKDITQTKHKRDVTSYFNKIMRFHQLRMGDVVMIPSFGSSHLAFGIVDDQETYIDIDNIPVSYTHLTLPTKRIV